MLPEEENIILDYEQFHIFLKDSKVSTPHKCRNITLLVEGRGNFLMRSCCFCSLYYTKEKYGTVRNLMLLTTRRNIWSSPNNSLFFFFSTGGGVSIAKRKSILVAFYKSVVGTLFPPQESATSVQGMAHLPQGWILKARSEKNSQKIIYFGLKWGQRLKDEQSSVK